MILSRPASTFIDCRFGVGTKLGFRAHTYGFSTVTTADGDHFENFPVAESRKRALNAYAPSAGGTKVAELSVCPTRQSRKPGSDGVRICASNRKPSDGGAALHVTVNGTPVVPVSGKSTGTAMTEVLCAVRSVTG